MKLPKALPVAIGAVHLWLRGPVDKKNPGILNNPRIGRWFKFAFGLVDSSNNWTTSQGEVTFALIPESFSPDGLGADERSLRKAVWHSHKMFSKTITVEDAHIQQLELSNDYGKNWQELLYAYSLSEFVYGPHDFIYVQGLRMDDRR